MITIQQNGSPNSPTEHRNTPHNNIPVAVLIIRYKQCLKNHAASIGGNAVDGCGEFMPSISNGNDPSKALECSVCGCHRNFHHKEVKVESNNNTIGKIKAIPKRHQKGHQISTDVAMQLKSPNMGADSTPSESNNDLGDGFEKKKRRFRTKFSKEQKEKLMRFADRAGWKMHKLDQCVVHNFCQGIGINRKVLKVWIHNNKHKYANKNHHF